MALDMEQVKKLRERTGISILECKKAVRKPRPTSNCMNPAQRLSKPGQVRGPNQGAVRGLHPHDGQIGVVVGSAAGPICGRKGTSGSDQDFAMQIAAMNPRSSRRTSGRAGKERIFCEQLKASGKPAAIVEKIVEGKLSRFTPMSASCAELFQGRQAHHRKTRTKKIIKPVKTSWSTVPHQMDKLDAVPPLRRLQARPAEAQQRGPAGGEIRHQPRHQRHRLRSKSTTWEYRSPSSPGAATSSAAPAPANWASTGPRPTTWACWPP
jgi:hypothetical protein